jgi:hypothetical protein
MEVIMSSKRSVATISVDENGYVGIGTIEPVAQLDVNGQIAVKGDIITASVAELNKSDGIATTAYQTVMAEVLFTEAGAAGVYTGTIALPAGSRIIDVGVDGIALWTAGTSAKLIVGDGSDDNGFFTETSLKATDLIVGEINNIEHPGGKAGAYITAEQRKLYSAAARNIIGVLTTVGTAASTGKTRLYVVYATPTAGAATKA